LLITALGNGLALEKPLDPDAIADETYGDLLVLISNALVALTRVDDEIKPTRRKDRARARKPIERRWPDSRHVGTGGSRLAHGEL
jgi:hypothetical protein